MSSQAFGVKRVVLRAGPLLALLLASLLASKMHAQTCTTQAKMSSETRANLSGAALDLAQSIKDGNPAKVQAATIAEFASASAFASTAEVIHSTSPKIAGDTLAVTQIYVLDATARAVGDTSEADFSCALTDTTSETDFSISGLPRGLYGFAMVEATGAKPWLLSFLLRQDSGVWKLAGFYPRARTAAGHDGVWYWTAARAAVKEKEPWLAWVYYGEADLLLRPANFATSTNLDRMRAEQSSAAPPELINGIGPDNPINVKGPSGTEYHFTSISADESENGKQLRLTLHMSADYMADPVAGKARNLAASSALLAGHKGLRQAFEDVWIFADSAGQLPLLSEFKMADIP